VRVARAKGGEFILAIILAIFWQFLVILFFLVILALARVGN
jgi:hypothetical protein